MNILEKEDEKDFLEHYAPEKYESPSVTADILIFTMGEKKRTYRELPKKELQVLLIKRGGFPYKDCWAVPGGFANMNENLAESAKRELFEETGLEDIYMEQLYTWGDVGRDPRKRIISVSYMALMPKKKLIVKAGDDANEADFFAIQLEVIKKEKTEKEWVTDYQLVLTREQKELSISAILRSHQKIAGTCIEEEIEILSSDIAFDHAKIIYYAIKRLRNKTEYTTIAFNLMDEPFSLGELQLVYSTILGRPLITPNFRRKMLPLLEQTEQLPSDNVGHRPPMLYQLKALRYDGEDFPL